MHLANQRNHPMSRYRHLAPVLLACALVPAGGAAQGDPWAAPLRGSWVRMGPVAAGDVVLPAGESGAGVVVGAGGKPNRPQAATVPGGEIGTNNGYRGVRRGPATGGKTEISIRP